MQCLIPFKSVAIGPKRELHSTTLSFLMKVRLTMYYYSTFPQHVQVCIGESQAGDAYSLTVSHDYRIYSVVHRVII